MTETDFSKYSMQDLFRIEAETQTKVLTSSLLALEREASSALHLESCMRAAHSLKGAAQIVNIPQCVMITHAMEDLFVAAQHGRILLTRANIDILLQGIDLVSEIAAVFDPGKAVSASSDARIMAFTDAISLMNLQPPLTPDDVAEPIATTSEAEKIEPLALTAPATETPADRMVRVNADSLNRLLGLAGEKLMEARSRQPFNDGLLHLKRIQNDLNRGLSGLQSLLKMHVQSETIGAEMTKLFDMSRQSQERIGQVLIELDAYDRRTMDLAHRLYDETLACRMRPFEEGVRRFDRLVRDLGHELGKQVRLEIVGPRTSVDRDILEQIDAPLSHLLRNAVDHGIEPPAIRRAAGKRNEGTVRIEARHSAGFLLILVEDDGAGIDLVQLRAVIIARGMVSAETANALSEAEILEFLFLPGFSMRDQVTEISGRGVGLDIVKDMVKQVHGLVRVTTMHGRFTRFQLQLPLTLSLVRSLLVEIDGEPYAFPLVAILRALNVSRDDVTMLQGRQHFNFEGREVGLITARQLFGRGDIGLTGTEMPVIVLGDSQGVYGLVVDRFIGQRELGVRPLDRRLGKIKDVSAASVMDDGSPVLIVDTDDLVLSIRKLSASGRLNAVRSENASRVDTRRKRVLVVDDSLTVRELERKLLVHHGYDVEVAVDGMDGWNAVRTGHFDLVVTDVDMPRMDGIELVTSIKRDPRLRDCPVMIVSYKDRETDRQRGLDAGADYYLTKGSFQDSSFVDAVIDLIGQGGSP